MINCCCAVQCDRMFVCTCHAQVDFFFFFFFFFPTRLTYMVVHIHVLVEAAAVADLNKRLPITV